MAFESYLVATVVRPTPYLIFPVVPSAFDARGTSCWKIAVYILSGGGFVSLAQHSVVKSLAYLIKNRSIAS